MDSLLLSRAEEGWCLASCCLAMGIHVTIFIYFCNIAGKPILHYSSGYVKVAYALQARHFQRASLLSASYCVTVSFHSCYFLGHLSLHPKFIQNKGYMGTVKNQFPCKISLTSAFISYRSYRFQHGDVRSPSSRKEPTDSPSSRHVCVCIFIGRLAPSVYSNCVMVLFSNANIEKSQKKYIYILLNHEVLPHNFRSSQGWLSPLTTAEKKRNFFSVQKQRVP
jgi:hypothetical protein